MGVLKMASHTIGGNPWASLTGPNFAYLLEQYDQYVQDPTSVDDEVKQLFDTWGGPADSGSIEQSRSSYATSSLNNVNVKIVNNMNVNNGIIVHCFNHT